MGRRTLKTPTYAGGWICLGLLVAVALALNLTLGSKGYWLGLFVFVATVAAIALPRRESILTLIALALLMGGVGLLVGADGVLLLILSFLVLAVGGSMLLSVHALDLVRELRTAREERARLAVAEERLRFARDLHDLLGHSLSLIALKSELAERLLERSPERAAAEIREVHAVAREALREVRQAVSGYRQPALSLEIERAGEALRAAGIAWHCEGVDLPVPPAAAGVLAWAVREGVTNVVRHSHARSCTLHLVREPCSFAVEHCDDGRGIATVTPGKLGNGLLGLAERATAQGGQFEAGPLPGGGFRLRVAVPVPEVARSAEDGLAVSQANQVNDEEGYR